MVASRLAGSAVCAGFLFCLGASVHAQEQTGDDPFYVSFGVDGYYTDNVFFSRPLYTQRRLDDWVTVYRPRIGYRYNFDQGRIVFGGYANIGRYSTYTSENYEDFGGSVDGLYRFSPTTVGVWGLSAGRGHEERNSLEPSDLIGINPTRYYKTSGYGAISSRIGDDAVKLGFTYDGFDYEDATTTVAPFVVNQDDRDRDMFTVGGRYTHRLDNRNSVYAEGTFDYRDYRDAVDDNGYMRDSSGWRGVVGWQAALDPYTRVELYGGVLYQDFRDSRFGSITTPDFGGLYTWQNNGTSVEAELARSLEETTLAATSSYVKTTGRLQLRQDLDGGFRVYGGASVAELDFHSSSRQDLLTSYWLGVRKYLTPHFFVGAEASYEENDSTQPTNDYTQTRIMARIGVDSQSAYDPDQTGYPLLSHSTFYVGASGAIEHLGTMLDGPRQNTNGSLTADFGAFGPAGRLLAGWGADFDKTYLGIEGDIGTSGTEWNHQRLPGGRVFSVKGGDTLGLSFLAGRRLPGGSLIYGRAGVRSTEFTTDYATQNASATINDHLIGLEFGTGIRAPLSNALALSLEYAHARYPDYAARAGNGTPDRFANVEDSVRVALSYHIGGIAGATEIPETPPSYAGAYWGVQGGVGTHSSLTAGPREPEGVPPVLSALAADFGDHGFTGGVLAGYNIQTGPYLFGAEVEGDVSHQSWDHERAPSGRTFSLRKHGDVGIAARAGYVLDTGAMVYGRIGAVSSYFSKDYSTTGLSITENEWRTGFRFGGGIEVPLTDTSRLRADYSFTDYGMLSLSTPSGVENYATVESLFRIGFLKNF